MSSVPVVPGGNLLGHGHLFHGDRLGFLRASARQGRFRVSGSFIDGHSLANSPEAAHAVLVERARSFEKSPSIRLVLRDIAGNGLFTSEGELWKRQRRLILLLFHATQLATYAGMMNAVARRALQRLEDGSSIDLAREMTRITMGVVSATLFGADTTAEADELGAALTIALKWVDDNVGFMFFLRSSSASSGRSSRSILTSPRSSWKSKGVSKRRFKRRCSSPAERPRARLVDPDLGPESPGND